MVVELNLVAVTRSPGPCAVALGADLISVKRDLISVKRDLVLSIVGMHQVCQKRPITVSKET